MGKISPVSAKYIIHTSIEIDGVVERPDVIGAVFGQTEGLLGADLELRELQRSGRIGRIEVNVDTRTGKTKGNIIVPSSLDKAETSIVAAALEIIQRIGPCNAKIKVENIEDVRVSKRHFVVERAKELLKMMTDKVLPDSQEITDEVAQSVRVMELQQYGRDRLAAGPAIDDSDEVIVVEGRADVLTLLKNGIKNAIAMNGTSCPETIKELAKKKTLTAFVDGDRGGNLIIKELTTVLDLDFVARAPDGKEVEELAKKEIHKGLRGRITAEQAKLELSRENSTLTSTADNVHSQQPSQPQPPAMQERPQFAARPQPPRFAAVRRGKSLTPDEKVKFRAMLEDLIGTRGAYILDEKLNILGKVPVSELATTIKSLGTVVYAVILDGSIERPLVEVAEKANISHVIAMDNKAKQMETRLNLLTAADL